MPMPHKVIAGLLLGTAADGFRIKTKATKTQPKVQGEPAVIQEEKGSAQTIFNEMRRQSEVSPNIVLNPDDFPKCHLSESDCSMKDMKEATLVYTDSDNSRCWNGEPWAFLVHPGRTDKLLYYFPNGGACWEFPFLLPGAASICLPNMLLGLSVTGYGNGVSDMSNPRNGFHDYTFISPPYCTGGAHVANSSVEGILGTYYQHDYNNNEFLRTWALKNVDPILENFVIAGSSAGSLGTMAWSDLLLSTFQYKKGTVIVDSYMGVFPEETQGPTIRDFEVCDLPIMAKFRQPCEAGTVNIQDIFDYTIGRHPKVAFAAVTPKWDLVQRAFYAALALSYLKLDLYKTATTFYKDVNEMMQRYGEHPNFVNYYIDGGFHTLLWWGYHYSATVSGSDEPDDTDGKPKLAEWVNALVNHQKVQSQCKGPLKPNGGGWLWFGGTEYCDKKLYPKTLSVAR